MTEPSSTPPTSAGSNRRSHRKSRTGCNVCRSRKVKCDEAKPQCGNCIKYKTRCEYPKQEPLNGLQRTLEISLRDMELLHCYSTNTCYTLSSDPLLQQFFRCDVPQIGFKNPYVLHGTLAMAALHLARNRKDEAAELVVLANEHQVTGMKLAAEAMSTAGPTGRAHAQYLFAILCCTAAFGNGPRPGSYLIFDVDRQNQNHAWLSIFRGIKSIFTAYHDQLCNSPISAMIEQGTQTFMNLRKVSVQHECFDTMASIIRQHSSDDAGRAVHLSELENLRLFLGPCLIPEFRNLLSPSLSLTWLYFISDDYISRLQHHEPIALLLFAHFCVILHEYQSFWWFQGWPEHLMHGAWTSMPAEYRPWLRWPGEQIGWIPPLT